MAPAGTPDDAAINLDAKWKIEQGRVLINGTQAIARVLLDRARLDARAGLNTAGYITGYRGSPLGNVDSTLWSIPKRLEAARITFQPGVNEDLAATAVRGTQQLEAVPDPLYDGVFAAWYGKGPGVDRSGDAFKHGNFAGTHAKGGVLLFYGDDHGGKSSTVSHHSEQAVAASLIPSLYPANVGEILEYGQLGFALSRYSGSWVALKCVNEVVEQTGTAFVDLAGFAPRFPPTGDLPPEGVHARRGSFSPIRDEVIVTDYRLPLVHKFLRANGIDHAIFRAPKPRLGLVTAGKSYGDTRQALALLGIDAARAAALGVSLYKLGCIWPIEPEGLAEFAKGHATLLVVEEKKSFIEQQAAAILINRSERPLLLGKRDEDGAALLSSALQLEPVSIAIAIADRMARLGIDDAGVAAARAELAAAAGSLADPSLPRRTPYFCSGCPHSRSTRVPEGSLSMTGIGCHTMVAFARPEIALLPTQMGGEGGNWIGLAPFTGTKHIFQNMGDGTYFHSGLLAIRAAVAAKVNITYKILYNDAVAMTGGQPVDGPISVAEIVQQVRHEGVVTVVLVSDNPAMHRRNPLLPADLRIEHRDDLDAVQRDMREIPGCSVLIYEQICAAEKRRRRKRGLHPDPPKRLFISQAVCEGCGDCSVQSTCVSLSPIETEFGIKRRIDQASCNKDYSCLNGFCPSFITVHGAEPRKPDRQAIDMSLFDGLEEPARADAANGYNMMITGIGGTGVTTVSAILGMAAHIDGKAVSMFDLTGLAQKNGAVFSHVRVADDPGMLHAQRIGRGEADLLLAFDLVAGVGPEAVESLSARRTRAVVNSDVVSTVAFQFDRDAAIDSRLLFARLKRQLAGGQVHPVDATTLANALFGDSIAANFFLVGVAAQLGLLPLGVGAIEQAVRLNGVAVVRNLAALRLGRLYATRSDAVIAMLPAQAASSVPATLEMIVESRARHLSAYQDEKLAARYRATVERVAEAERALADSSLLAMAVAHNYARLLAYKDEYEVARLLTDPGLDEELRRNFTDGARFSFNLAPPALAGKAVTGRPGKREIDVRLLRPALLLLKRMKRLRGTALDPFGYHAERRAERQMIGDYEALIATVLVQLTEDNLQDAARILAMVAMVRGYGPVKMEAINAYRSAVSAATASFAGLEQRS